jgi:hypothetical protein
VAASWLMTPAAAAAQRLTVARYVAAGAWHGPQPSPEVLTLAGMLAGETELELTA